MSLQKKRSKIVIKIIKRISRIMALAIVYIMCAYGYLTTKGFVLSDNSFILSHPVQAEEKAFAVRVKGDIGLSAERTRALGADTAPLTMFIFSSMSCAHCRDFHKFTLPKIERDFIATGKLRFVFVHFPLEAMSMRAAKLSYCLPAERFYKFIDELYDKKDWLFSNDEEKLYSHARRFGMSAQGLETCKADKKLTSDILLVKDNVIDNFGIKGTPAFIVEGADGKEMVLGTKSYSDWKEYLENRLRKQ